jgi:hypothetical protein
VIAGLVRLRLPRLHPGVGACFSLVGTSERLPMQTMGDVWSSTICESSVKSVWHVDRVFSMWGVHRFESPRLSDMSITCLQQSSCS